MLLLCAPPPASLSVMPLSHTCALAQGFLQAQVSHTQVEVLAAPCGLIEAGVLASDYDVRLMKIDVGWCAIDMLRPVRFCTLSIRIGTEC